jgi:hypothetical protein
MPPFPPTWSARTQQTFGLSRKAQFFAATPQKMRPNPKFTENQPIPKQADGGFPLFQRNPAVENTVFSQKRKFFLDRALERVYTCF